MALERQSIEKKDFPIGRRGYDPEAVDSHLSAVADDVDELKRSARQRAETLASSASEQVRSIVEAAERTAADIQRQAEDEAQEIRAEAAEGARSTREQATAQAREYVGKVSESTAVMLQRLDAMESELGALIEALRTGSNRLNADLQLLEGNLTEVSAAVAPRPRFEAEPGGETPAPAVSTPVAPAPAAPEPAMFEPQAAPAEAGAIREQSPDGIEEYGEPVEGPAPPAPTAVTPEVTPPVSAEHETASDETEGARLIALNMALNGTPREETDRYLAENFDLRDREGLLDEVYASVAG